MKRTFTGNCFKCRAPLDLLCADFGAQIRVGRGDTCFTCGADVRACLNCQHYNPSCYNECSEPIAERVVEKDRSNFCDMFVFVGGQPEDGSLGGKDSIFNQLDNLFRKPV